MSLTGITSNPAAGQLPEYFHQRGIDLRKMSQDLQSGDLAAAQQDYNSIENLAQNGPLPNGDAFVLSWRQQDFSNVGQALQAGDMSAAQSAFGELASTFGSSWSPTTTAPTATNSSSGINVSA